MGKRNKNPDRGVTKWVLNKCYNGMFETDLKTTQQFFRMMNHCGRQSPEGINEDHP